MPTPSVSGSVSWLMISSGGKVHSDTVNWEQVEARLEEGRRERSMRRAAKKGEMLGVKGA